MTRATYSNLQQEDISLAYCFRGIQIHSGGAEAWQQVADMGARARNQRARSFKHKHEAERANWKWGKVFFKSQSLPP